MSHQSLTTDDNSILEGSCACYAVKWKSVSAPSILDFCYCTQCQRITGAPFGAWMSITKSALTFTGPVKTCKISDIAVRSLCEDCGASLTIQYHCYPNKTHVAAGTIVKGAEAVPKVGCHLFVGKKPLWYGIPADGVSRWDEFPDDFLEVFDEWKATGGSPL